MCWQGACLCSTYFSMHANGPVAAFACINQTYMVACPCSLTRLHVQLICMQASQYRHRSWTSTLWLLVGAPACSTGQASSRLGLSLQERTRALFATGTILVTAACRSHAVPASGPLPVLICSSRWHVAPGSCVCTPLLRSTCSVSNIFKEGCSRMGTS